MDSTLPDDLVGRLSDSLREHESERDSVQAALPRYDVVGEAARGGMGIVYRAWDRTLGRQVAIKVLDRDRAPAPEAAARFLREAQLAARLNHPHIVPVYDSGTWMDTGNPYLVMQWIDGGTLADARLRDPRDIARHLARAAEGVHYAHEQGVIHRDIKPQNLMLDREGHVFVADFGLAKAVARGDHSSLSTPGDVVGTPSYMSPEQALGKTDQVDARSDVYSLGATLYMLTTGSPPFRGATPEEVRVNVVTATLLPPSRLRPDCPAELEEIILRAMAREKSARFESAGALATELDTFARGSLRKLRRTQKRRLVIGLVTALGAVVALLAFEASTRLTPNLDEPLRQLGDLIDRGELEEARTVRDAMSASSDQRLVQLREKYDRRRRALLDQDEQILLMLLATDADTGAVRQRMRGLDGHAVYIARAEASAGRLRDARDAAIAAIWSRDYAEALRQLDAVALERLAWIQPRLAEPLLADLEQFAKQWEPAPLQELGAIATRLRVEDEPALAHVKWRDLACEAHTPGITIERLGEIIAQIERHVPESPFLAEIRDLRRALRGAMSRDARIADSWKSALAAFRARRLAELGDCRKSLDEAGARQVGFAEEWLRRFLAGEKHLPELSPEFSEGAAALLAERDVESQREAARLLALGVIEKCDAWDLEGAHRLLAELKASAADGAGEHRRLAAKRVSVLEEIEQHVSDCRALIASRKLADALRAIETVCATAAAHPRLWELWFEQGRALYRERAVDEAWHAFDEAAKRTSIDSRPLYWRGVCKPCMADFAAAVKRGCAGADVHRQMALVAIEEGNFDAAVGHALDAVRYVGALTEDERAARGAEHQQPEPAATQFKRDAFYTLAKAYFKLDRKEECILACSETVQRDAGFAEGWYLRAHARYNSGDYKEALVDFEAAAKLSTGRDAPSIKRLASAKSFATECRKLLK